MTTNLGRTLPRILFASCRLNNSTFRWSHAGVRATKVVFMPRIHLRNLSTNLFPRNSKATVIPLPGNVQDINAIETARFSPQRNRDRSSEVISAQFQTTSDDSLSNLSDDKEGVESYDCTGTVSLNSAMQTNVPEPYSTKQKSPVHLNMPGGEWSRSDKYIAEDMQKAFFDNTRNNHGQITHADKGIYAFSIAHVHGHQNRFNWWNGHQSRLMSTSPGQGDEVKKTKLSNVDLLRKTAIEYGSTVIVFHVTISILSLGICYLCVTSGINLQGLISYLPVEVPEEVGGFVIAYAIHKALLPVRVSTTVVCVPFIVKYLRGKGILKVAPHKYYKK